MNKLDLKKKLEKSLFEEGYDPRRFSIFESNIPDCYHLADTTSDDSTVFYLDERGYRREEQSFYVLEDALSYLKFLMDSAKKSNFIVPVSSPSIEEDFILEKKRIEELIEKKIESEDNTNFLYSLLRIVTDLDINRFTKQKSELLKFISNNFQNLDKDLRDEILIFQNSYN